MTKDLKLCLIQTELSWQDAAKNRKNFEEQFKEIEDVDVIILPEMFSTAFTMESAKVAEKMDGITVSWMRDYSKSLNAAIAGSLIIEEDGEYFNRFIWAEPDGKVKTYDKRHLFRMADEEKHFKAGEETILIEYRGWKIMPLVCYDLRFPVWSRRTAKKNYDLLIYVANWPRPRASAWRKLLYARAIENQAYVAGVNRVGKDLKDNEYIGNSAVIDTKGELMVSSVDEEEQNLNVTLSHSDLLAFREKFPVGLDGDSFEIIN